MRRVLKLSLLLLLCVMTSVVHSQDVDDDLQRISAYLAIGNYKECRESCQKLIRSGRYTDAQSMLSIEVMLATADFVLGYPEEGIYYLSVAEKRIDEAFNPASEEYIQWLIAFSTLYSHVGDPKTHVFLERAIKSCEENGWTRTQTYVLALVRLCSIYNKMNMDSSAAVDEILHRLLPLSQQVCGFESLEYSLSLMEAIKNADRKGNVREVLDYTEVFVSNPNLYARNEQIRFFVNRHRLHALVALNNYKQAVQEANAYSAELRKRCFEDYGKYSSNERWEVMQYIQSWFLNEYPRLLDTESAEEIVSPVCDGLLFAKGLMLSLEALQSKGGNDFIQVDWQRIEKCLNFGEAAIEFYCISDDRGLFWQHNYKAIIIKKGFTKPLLVNIGELRGSNSDAETVALFCWEPLKGVLRDVKQLYFSPHGQLHTIPIEAFLPQELRGMKACRLSSIRQIVNRQNCCGNGAVLFGGLTYNMDIEEMKLFAQKRGAECMLSYLPGTQKEIDEVANVLHSKAEMKKIMMYSGRNGTEESFKALNNMHVRVIHIATHGFYYRNMNTSADKAELDNLSDALSQTEDKSLTRSGLFFAGAENSVLGETVPLGVEDGVLTAQEVSQLILDGTELVVLSACETGQGDITSDGVFGLQRGFKKAGVQSILMSLWKVDDEATCLLMTEFYKNWIVKGKTKYDALEIAKQIVRSHKEKGWDDPKYWAAFILLDALN